jgi:DNA protecting protein DprA
VLEYESQANYHSTYEFRALLKAWLLQVSISMIQPCKIYRFTRNTPPPGISLETWAELWSVPERPLRELYIQGTDRALGILSQLPNRGLAIVGTREPQPQSIHHMRECILSLGREQIIVISGLARGIDSNAHQAALDANIPTLAILGAGLDIPYPRQNQALRDRILESDGLLISEFPPGTPPLPGHFIQRNRIIATWSKAVWVVEASLRSGALNTAKWAREKERLCFATPWNPTDSAFSGNRILIDHQNAHVLWGPHSLGISWLELSCRGEQLPLPLKKSHCLTDEYRLVRQVAFLTKHQGGAPIQELLDWAISTQGWLPQRFFLTLQKTRDLGLLLDENGLLLKKVD